jgi:hypothetical protein
MSNYFNSNRRLSDTYADDWFKGYRDSLARIYGVVGNMRTPLKICLAHFGGDQEILAERGMGGINNPVGRVQQNWCKQIRTLMTEFEGIYTDISYALFDRNTHEFVLKELDNQNYGDKILFGTDFFLTEQEMPEKTDYTIFQQDAQNFPLTRIRGRNGWDQIASFNPEEFLFSKYYNGTVI